MKKIIFIILSVIIISCDGENNMVTNPEEIDTTPNYVGIDWILTEWEYANVNVESDIREMIRFDENTFKTYIRYSNYENTAEGIRDSMVNLIDYGTWEEVDDRIEIIIKKYKCINGC